MSGYWLIALGAIPLVGALVVAFLPKGRDLLAKQITLGTSLAALVVAVIAAAQFKPSGARFQGNLSWSWIKSFGVSFAVGVDGIALVLVLLIAVLVPVVVIASWNDETPGNRSPRAFFGWLLALEVMMIGVFVATDVFLFYVFFEAMLVPMYFLIGSYGGPRRQYAAMKFFLYSLLGGLIMLAAVITLYFASPVHSFAFMKLVGTVDPGYQKLLFFGFFIAFAIKAPLVPFHTWLPDAGAEAPIGGAVLLVGVLDKVGTFGFLRYCLPLFPDASRYFAPLVLILSVIGIIYGAIVAVGQRDMKRLVAYTSIAHFGFIGLGIFAFTTQGGSGAVLYMVNHGLSTGMLFIVVGILITRGKSRLIGDYGGVASVTPWLSGVFLFAGLSSLALPGLSTFISEFLTLVGTFTVHRVYAIIATVGIIFAALYVLWMYQRLFHGPLGEKVGKWKDLTGLEAWAVGPLLVLIVFLGVYPKPILSVINPAVKATMHDVGKHDPAPTAGSVAK
ncbi:MAG TPA: NADH-quinone oxidoreductase subunit M [Mycobacteriales bacterium]|jgi:NADH-quinone oxidoreductase subunit M|nr:NADH-quinone oxidoreductase subunit M [Mycobacteriales bacterium]